jgi:hypothetical protein
MNMRSMTRKRFLEVTTKAVPAALVFGVGCSSDNDNDNDNGAGTTSGTTNTTTSQSTSTMGSTTASTSTSATTAGESTTMNAESSSGGAESSSTGGESSGMTTAPACAQVMTEVGPPSMGPAHSHTVEVPAEDVAQGTQQMYMLSFSAGHVHEMTVTEDDFSLLRNDGSVVVDTTMDATGHTHPVTLMCS